MRAQGARVGHFRPITLWPFPSEALASFSKTAKRVAVFEQNAGQMIDDVKLAVLGAAEVVAIGGISTDTSGFGVGSMLDVERIRARIDTLT
jgi:2-oxoglutarate ferredoxin oxidoreductase subunit alpha